VKVIGAGLPRTATTTQMIALEMLGLPCYHMRDMMSDLETSVPQWRAAFEGNGNWDEIFEGKESIVDFPGSYYWRELMDVYPEAKVLLSVRSAESWVNSMQSTIAAIWFGDSVMHHLAQAQYQIDPVYASWLDVLHDMWVKADMLIPSKGDPERMAAEMERWNQDVIDTVPAERLLVWNPAEGWEPLCEFLELPVPEQPLPHVNDTENFQKALIMAPAINSINEWWEREKPEPVPA
jgi:Sulfotransferase domain